MVFREGRTKAVGTILRNIPLDEEMARGLTLSRVRSAAAADRLAAKRDMAGGAGPAQGQGGGAASRNGARGGAPAAVKA